MFSEIQIFNRYGDELIDGLVYELYFPDDMTEEEKLAIDQREFDCLYDPRHPVRNYLETIDSVEVVRILREALKK